MISLNRLSHIGFGSYRVGEHDAGHRDALLAALDAGCNLIDTSSNYGNGASERLIGSVLRNVRGEAFVVTKAGYVDGDNLALLAEALRRGMPANAIGRMSASTLYSIHPLYLGAQMDESRRRLRTEVLDAVLLHNPEHLLACAFTREEMHRAIARAFEFFEACVERGVLRYYGISSSALDVDALPRMPNLQFVEVPLNLVERDALPEVAKARALRLTVLTNRPFNARVGESILRLSDDAAPAPDPRPVIDAALARLRNRLHDAGEDDDPLQFDVVRILATRIASIGTTDAVEALFTEHFHPLIDALGDDAEGYRALYDVAIAHARAANALAARAFRVRAEQEHLIGRSDAPLVRVACEQYLAWGADHVLAGMRRRTYVDQLAPLFAASAIKPGGRAGGLDASA